MANFRCNFMVVSLKEWNPALWLIHAPTQRFTKDRYLFMVRIVASSKDSDNCSNFYDI